MKRQIAELASLCAALEAAALFAAAEEIGGARLVAGVVKERDVKALKALAEAVRGEPRAVAAVGAAHAGAAALVVARAEGIALDVRPILKRAAEVLGARGGGTAQLAQCGGGDPSRLPAALGAAEELIRAALEGGGGAPS
jgi:alanyl-tRNA synthetase